MPAASAIKRARRDKKEGKSASTQAGEFVRQEIEEIRQGKHGARSVKQAIAIGLSEARRSGIKLPIPEKGSVSDKTRKAAINAQRKAEQHEPISKKRSKASLKALKKEPTNTVSAKALSKHAHEAAMKHTKAERSAIARKAAITRKREK